MLVNMSAYAIRHGFEKINNIYNDSAFLFKLT